MTSPINVNNPPPLKIWAYWIDEQHTYIGMCYRWNLHVMQATGALTSLTLLWIFSRMYNQLIPAGCIATILGTIAYAGILMRAQQYYLLDEHGLPVVFRSTYKPDSIRRVRPLTREQFLKRVAAGATGTLA